MKMSAYPAVRLAYRDARKRLARKEGGENELRLLAAQLEFLERIFDV